MSIETIKYDKDAEGIVTLTMDDPTQSANTMRRQFVDDYTAVAERLAAEKDDIAGVILASAKSTFFAGGDLKEMIQATPDDADEIAAMVNRVKAAMRTIETLGVPVVAAINGPALGGGFELTLACHRRIASKNPKTRIGFPEVTLGLLPGAGGVVRSVRMFGIAAALLELLLKGQQLRLEKAVELGVVDEIVDDDEAMIAAAKKWILDNPESAQPWDAKGYEIPGGTLDDTAFAQIAPSLPATLKSMMKGADYDAPAAILATAVEGAGVGIDQACAIETRYFVELVCMSPQAKNMMQAFFFDLQAINKGGSRPDGYDKWKASKVAVLGAGMMGAGIAYQCAKCRIDVVLKDLSVDNAEKGKDYSRGLVAKAVGKGRMTQEAADALLNRISTTGDTAELAGCDIVIEAVFESADLKKKIFAETEPVVDGDALLCSNTSTLPITELATGVERPEDFVGLHFFSPVDKMPLVEIIKGAKTSDAALAKAVDLVQQIKKTPIVVNDSRGFFTSRVIGTFMNEAVAALAEGVSPIMIERAGSAAGYPAPPLQLLDELTLTLPRKIRNETRSAIEASRETYVAHPGEAVIDRMVEEFGREGRSSGKGFYDYDENGKRTELWPGLFEHFAPDTDGHIHPGDAELFEDLIERMLFAEAIETAKCFDENVLITYPDANIGSIFGIGFPAWTGGVAQYIDQYPGGVTGFVGRCKELADRYGERFVPPASLIAKAESGEPFRPDETRV